MTQHATQERAPWLEWRERTLESAQRLVALLQAAGPSDGADEIERADDREFELHLSHRLISIATAVIEHVPAMSPAQAITALLRNFPPPDRGEILGTIVGEIVHGDADPAVTAATADAWAACAAHIEAHRADHLAMSRVVREGGEA